MLRCLCYCTAAIEALDVNSLLEVFESGKIAHEQH
jgi:hypothetical protein